MDDPFIVVGVDPAKTKLAAVASSDEGFEIYTRTMPDDISMCCDRAMVWMQRLVVQLQRENPFAEVWVFIELPVVGRGGVVSTLQQAFVQGGLLAGARRGGAFRVVQVNNSTMKKQVCGYGKASKADMATHIKKTWPALYRAARGNQDVIDSAIVTEYGHLFIKRSRKMRRTFRR